MSQTDHFEIALEDHEAAEAAQEYDLYVFDLPAHPDPKEKDYFAAVRPAPDAWLGLSRSVYVAKQNETEIGVTGIKFLNECFQEEDLRAALIETGEYDDVDGDGDGELSAFGIELSKSNSRINDRLLTRKDPFGKRTLVEIFIRAQERWSGNPTGSQLVSSRQQRRAGARSTARKSSKASTSSKSSTGRRRVS